MTPESFAQFGITGLVLFWFMIRNETKTDKLSRAINNQTLIMISLIDVIASCPNNNVSYKGKSIKQEEIQKIRTKILQETD